MARPSRLSLRAIALLASLSASSASADEPVAAAPESAAVGPSEGAAPQTAPEARGYGELPPPPPPPPQVEVPPGAMPGHPPSGFVARPAVLRLQEPVREGALDIPIVNVRGRRVVLGGGTANGLELGQHVVVYEDTVDDLGDGHIGHSRRRVAVGEIIRVADQRAEVEFGLGETVTTAMHGRVTTAATSAHLASPPRFAGLLELSVSGTALAVTTDVGGGAVFGARATYHGQKRYFLQVELLDSGFAIRKQRHESTETLLTTGALASAGFDHRFLAFGVGIGIVRTLPATIREYDGSTYEYADFHYGAKAAFAYALSSRAGAVDGLHVRLSLGFANFHGEFRAAHLDTAIQIPLSDGFWAVLHGASGFGATGYSEADVSARILVRGDGGRGSLFVTPGVGWAQLAAQSVQYEDWGPDATHRGRGPAARVSVEYRR